MKYLIGLGLVVLMASCGVHNSSFDCPPGQGMGCASVNEVLELIVEKTEGEDVFVRDKGTALLLRQQEEEELIYTATRAKKKYYLVQDDDGNWKLVKLPKEQEP